MRNKNELVQKSLEERKKRLERAELIIDKEIDRSFIKERCARAIVEGLSDYEAQIIAQNYRDNGEFIVKIDKTGPGPKNDPGNHVFILS